MLKPIQTSMLALSLLAFAGCSSWQPMCPDYGTYRICYPTTKLEASNATGDMAARLAALERERQ